MNVAREDDVAKRERGAASLLINRLDRPAPDNQVEHSSRLRKELPAAAKRKMAIAVLLGVG